MEVEYMKTIRFDEHCTGWNKNIDWNRMFLKVQREYIYERLQNRGYMYLNDIYEGLGAMWNPDEENVCYRATDVLFNIEFEPIEGNVFLVKIYH
jgi:hypothetical protein